MKNFSFKRLTAWLLVFMTVLSVLPASVIVGMAQDLATAATGTTTDETIYVLAGGDFQEAGDHTASAENVTNILKTIKKQYPTMNGFLFVGDYDCETHDDSDQTTSGIAKLMETVQASYSNINHDNSILAQGNHDATNEYIDGSTTGTYGYDLDGYAAFVLNEDQYPNYGGTSSGVKNLANTLKVWLEDKIDEKYNKPIFIVSHLPLAFNPRTNVQGDGMYAKYIFDVLNDAAAQGLNIFFLHGHNHAFGYDEYLGGHAIYLAKGDSINIAEEGSKTSYTTEKLNFTYMNAGYTGYYNESDYTTSNAGTDKLSMTVFAITGTDVTIGRYSADGAIDLKVAGEAKGNYFNNVSVTPNTTVYTTTQTITLNKTITGGTTTPPTLGSTGSSTNGWIQISSASDATGYKYELDTDGIEYGESNKYIIVAKDQAVALYSASATDDTSNDTVFDCQSMGVTLSSDGATLTTDTRDYDYYFTNSGWITKDGSKYLYQKNWDVDYGTGQLASGLFGATHYGSGQYRLYDTNNNNESSRTLFYDSSNSQGHGVRFTVTASDHENKQYSVRLYKYVGEVTGEDLYAKMEIAAGAYTDFNAGASQERVEEVLKDHIRVYTSATASGEGTLISDSDVTWTWDGGFNEEGYSTMVVSYKGKELGSVTVHVAVEPGTGTNNGWVVIETTPGTDAGYTYTLDTDGITLGNNYIIAAPSNSYAMTNNGTTGITITNTDLTFSGNTITSANIGPEWTIDSNSRIYKTINGINYYLQITGTSSVGLTNSAANATVWTITETSTDGCYQIYATYNNRSRYLRYSSNTFSVSTSSSNSVRIYGDRSHNEGTPDVNTYAAMTGTLSHTVAANSMTAAEIEALAKADIKAYTSKASGPVAGTIPSDATEITDALTIEWDKTVDPSKEGNYVMTVSYKDQTLGTVNVCIQERVIEKIDWPTEGYIDQYTTGNEYIKDANGQTVMFNVYYEGEENPVSVPLTLGMINENGTSKAGDQSELLITYGTKISDGDFTLHVKAIYVNDYPEYPDEGAIKVNKTATGIDFQTTGLAQIELSTSGVPVKKGADVIVMLDTSSSMDDHVDENGDGERTSDEPRRIDVLNQSMNNLITQLQSTGPDGEPLDIRIAIGTFNGFYGAGSDKSGTPYDRDENDKTANISYPATSYAEVLTGEHTLSDAFEPASGYKWTNLVYNANDTGNDDLHSGTNYDYAMDAIYQMGASIKDQNLKNGEDRDLYVIFLSDGAAMQWNYYHSQGASETWEHWITGDQPLSYWEAISGDSATSANGGMNCAKHLYYFDNWDHDGDGYVNEHRMANAIKGDPRLTFEVIRKSTDGLAELTNTANINAISNKDNMYKVNGLGATMWSISFDATTDTNVEAEHMIRSIASLASPQTPQTQYAYNVSSAQALGRAFTTIGNEISYAAENAVFKDQMGDGFKLQMDLPKDPDGNVIEGIEPMIEVLEYDIWTRAEYDSKAFTDINMIGTRKGTYRVTEVVMFKTVNGVLRAYSSSIDADNDGTNGVKITENADSSYSYAITDEDDFILSATAGTDGNGFEYIPGVIYARSFIYNSNPYDINVLIHGTEITVAAESFYWNIGTVMTTEQALRYYVYLEGAMEGTKPGGSYATNNYATLYYNNYLGNECQIGTTSPKVAWLAANVSYAFYLVDQNGNVITNQTNGDIGSFANKIAVTNPVLYEEILLNNEDTIRSIKVTDVAGTILPDGYELYDEKATYFIHIGSGSNFSYWNITAGSDKIQSTYVTGYDMSNPAAFSSKINVSTGEMENYEYNTNADLTHTIVWFAVLWTPQALPDTVVVDYGLPVDVSVLVNDMFGDNCELIGVAPYDASHDAAINALIGYQSLEFGTTAQGKFGIATANPATGKIRYELTTMNIDGYDKFTYQVEYTGKSGTAPYYYDTITIIPATTIYFEESFVEFTNSSASAAAATDTDTMGIWQDTGAFDKNATQGEDRPDIYSLPQVDRNWVYGFDGINSTSTTYSLGNAKWVNVDAATGKPSTAPSAQFTFTGTGFDIISMTDNTSGAIFVNIRKDNAAGALVKQLIVDNYYGYKYEDTDGDGVKEWISDSTSTGKIYQVPVIKLSGLDHGTYHVTIQVAYMTAFDHQPNDSLYTFVLDSIRIYDPVNPAEADTVITDAYKADGEFNPTYTLIKDKILDPTKINNSESSVTTIKGVVFIDGMNKTDNAFDYSNPGPNNETYLAVGQYVTFKIQTNFEPDKTMIGAKIASGTSVTLTVSYTTGEDNQQHTITNGKTITTATDMYYELAAITWTRLTQTDESGNVTYLDKWVSPIITLSNGQAVKNESDTEYATNAILSLTNLKITEKIASTGNIISGDSTVIDTPDGVFGTETTAPASASYEAIVTDGMLAPEINDGDIAPTPIEGSIEAAAPAFEEVEAPAPETVEESEEPEADTAVEVIETDTPNTITLIVDQEVIDHANFILNPVFEPEYIQYKTKKVGFGSFATNYLLVVTSNDVASLTANGVALTKVTSNYQVTTRFGSMRSLEKEFGVDIDGGEYTMWMYSSKDASFEIVAGNSEGICSEPVAAEVASSGGIGSFFGSLIGSVLDSFFGKKETAEEIEVPDYSEIMKQLAQRYFNPEKFEADIGERADSKKQLVIEASEDVAYVIVNGKIIRNYITETVVDLENNGEETVKRIFVAYVSGEGSVEIAAYNAEGVASSAKVAEN